MTSTLRNFLPVFLAFLGWPNIAAGAALPTTFPLILELQPLQGKLPEETAGQLLLSPADGREVPNLALPCRLWQRVELPAGSKWTLDFAIPGFWGPRTELEVSADGQTSWIFNLWPAGKVRGQFRSRDQVVPKTFDVFGELPGGLRPMSRCDMAPKGTFECGLPLASRNLVFSVGTYAPVRFRTVRIEPGRPLELGPIDLFPGASIVGRVALEDGLPPGAVPAGAIRLFRAVAAPDADGAEPKPITESVLAPDGYFAFVGLEPAAVVLEVTKPGFAPARLGPLELTAGIELEIPEPLRLVRPLEIVVEIAPATDPFGRPWQVGLVRSEIGTRGGRHDEGFAGETDAEGRLRVPDQDPGRYLLRVEDSAGNRMHFDSELWLREQADALVRVELKLLEVRGEVTRAGRTLPCRLFFGGRTGTLRVEAETNDEGEFETTLPRPGKWTVDLAAEGLETRLRAFVEPGLAGHRATVNLEVPDTEIFGRVVDDAGRGVAGAEVFVGSEGYAVAVESGVDGRFQAQGVTPGLLPVNARSPGRELLTSDEQVVDVRKGQSVGPLELRLTALTRTAGRVHRAGDQPVPGTVVGVVSQGGKPFADHATCDAEGAFTVRTDPKATHFSITVLPPGGALTVFDRPNNGSPFDLSVESAGGELEIRLPWGGDELTRYGGDLRVFRNQTEVAVPWLFQWVRALGLPLDSRLETGTLTVPSLAPGSYLACFGKREPIGALPSVPELQGSPGVVCRGGHLEAGGRLTLDLPLPR